MSDKITFKRGDTFALSNQFVDDSTGSDVPVNLTGWSIRSQLRQGDTLIATLDYEVVDVTQGTYTLGCLASLTALWPLGSMQGDIEYTAPSGSVVSTETFFVAVIPDVTR